MEIRVDPLQQLAEQMMVYGVKTQTVVLNEKGFRNFYPGVYVGPETHFDYAKTLNNIKSQFREEAVYAVRHELGTRNYFFLLPEEKAAQREVVHVGPFLTEAREELLAEMTEKYRLDIFSRRNLEEYYYSLPQLAEGKFLEALLMLQASLIYGKETTVRIEHAVDFYGNSARNLKRGFPEPSRKISAEALEERYAMEEELLEALTKGDRAAAYAAHTKLSVYRPKQRMEDTLENQKYALLSENTLYRKAVQTAGVHPVHLDQVSGYFVKRIERCVYEKELKEMSREMIRRYCLLVKKYALLEYSAVVRNALNYIDLHLSEPISLKKLAQQGNVSTSYLSTRFRKEVGRPIMDYVNEQRILESRKYLAATDLAIGEIAEKVGVGDGNYFTKLFKKYHKCTPKEYRNIIR